MTAPRPCRRLIKVGTPDRRRRRLSGRFGHTRLRVVVRLRLPGVTGLLFPFKERGTTHPAEYSFSVVVGSAVWKEKGWHGYSDLRREMQGQISGGFPGKASPAYQW